VIVMNLFNNLVKLVKNSRFNFKVRK